MYQKLTVQNPVHLPKKSQPIRHGVPWPRRAIKPDTPLSVLDENGAMLACASRVLNCWPDGSVQWSLVDFAIDLEPSETRTWNIATSENAPPLPMSAVVAQEFEDGVSVANGLTTLELSTDGKLIKAWRVGARDVLQSQLFDVVIRDEDGQEYSVGQSSMRKVCLEDANAFRATIRVEGKHQASNGSHLLDFWLRFIVTAGREDIRITYNYRNREDAEPGIRLQSMTMRLQAALPEIAERAIVQVNRSRDFRTEPVRIHGDFEICSSNTPDLETYPQTHQGITGGGLGRVFIRQPELLSDNSPKPWFLRSVQDFKFGAVFPPETAVWNYLGLISEVGSLLVAGGNMVGLHPKSLKVCGADLEYSIWPEWAGAMEITQGEGRTVDFYLAPLPPKASDEELLAQYFSWEYDNVYHQYGGRSPVKVSLDNEHVRRCEVFGVEKLPAYEPEEHFAFERKVQANWTPDEPALPHGHWHYGDEFLNYSIGVNNEEMCGLVWFQQYLRTGRAQCLDRGLAQAQHIMDVDIVMHSSDPYQNGGMCAHGPRHNHCAAYPSHMWFTELLFAYALTGDEEFKRAAVRVCDNLVFWINDEKGFEIVSADGRESGQPLINLAWTYSLVSDQKYLDAMWKIVRSSFMAKVEKHGQLAYMKPREDFALLIDEGYGQWAAWEGLYWVWELTRDDELKHFILSQLEWRLTEERMSTHGSFRATDFNVAAYAFLMTQDRSWLDRVARAFRVAWRASEWQFGWIKSMYFIKLAFEHQLIRDDDVLVS